MLKDMPKDTLIDPIEVGEAYFYLHNQKPCAWTFELDIRNNNEPW